MNYFLIFLFSLSCSNLKESNDISIVDLKRDQNSKISIEDNEVVSINEKKDSVKIEVSLQLYSSIYHSLGLLKLFRELEKEKIEITNISSFGFGALISALYAKEGKISYLEWKLFDLLKRLKGKEPYSKHWSEVVEQFVDKEFKKTDFKELKIGISIPKIIANKILLSNEKLSVALKNTLNISSKNNFISNPNNYMARLREKGEHLVFPLIFIPEQPKIEKMNNFNYGLFTSYLGKLYKRDDEFSKISTNKIHALDRLESTNHYEEAYSESVKIYVESLKEKIELWFEERSNQENYTN